jgi:hypothetical protein
MLRSDEVNNRAASPPGPVLCGEDGEVGVGDAQLTVVGDRVGGIVKSV